MGRTRTGSRVGILGKFLEQTPSPRQEHGSGMVVLERRVRSVRDVIESVAGYCVLAEWGLRQCLKSLEPRFTVLDLHIDNSKTAEIEVSREKTC